MGFDPPLPPLKRGENLVSGEIYLRKLPATLKNKSWSKDPILSENGVNRLSRIQLDEK